MLHKMSDNLGILLWRLSFSMILGKLFNLSNFCQVKRICTTESIKTKTEQKTFIKAALQQQWTPIIHTSLNLVDSFFFFF